MPANRPFALPLLLAAAVISSACEKAPSPNELSVAELSGLLEGDQPPTVLDANDEETRRELGVIPGATLLTSDDAQTLERIGIERHDKLVFYCSNTRCKAAEGAAKNAIVAGYEDVHVLPDGILGWRDAGKTVQRID